MPRVLIVVEPSEEEVTNSPVLKGMLAALEIGNTKDVIQATSVEVVAANTLTSKLQKMFNSADLYLCPPDDHRFKEVIFCPLTLFLPENLAFPFQGILQACRNVVNLRQLVAEKMQVAIGKGCFWLPIVLTAKGPLYGEVIALTDGQFTDSKSQRDLSLFQLSYYQPFHLSDALRQPLYIMAYQLLQSLSAPPATYLMQFGLQKDRICFDRLWPFPAAPALASMGIQEPDLFTSHLYCLASKPIFDLTIMRATNSTN